VDVDCNEEGDVKMDLKRVVKTFGKEESVEDDGDDVAEVLNG
jgi:hypothetical protein